jgi:hypothetical protein
MRYEMGRMRKRSTLVGIKAVIVLMGRPTFQRVICGVDSTMTGAWLVTRTSKD